MQTEPNNNSALYTEAGKSKIFLSMLELMRNYGSVFFNAALNKKCFFSQIPKSALRYLFKVCCFELNIFIHMEPNNKIIKNCRTSVLVYLY